jgi:membrane fusion protein, multidrug efflux system
VDEKGNREKETANRANYTLVEVMPADGPDGSKKPAEQKDAESKTEHDDSADSEQPAESDKPRRLWLKYAIAAAIILVIVVSLPFLIPWIDTILNTVSTDDAYVNGHVTFVAPRVAGQVSRVLVDDNMRVKKGDLLVELDKEPFRVQLLIKQAAVTAAEKDLKYAKAQVGGLIGLARSQRWMLQSAMDQVVNQVANLRANVATYESRKASHALAISNYQRGKALLPSGGVSKEDYDQRQQTVKVDEADVKQALEMVYATRASLGIPPQPGPGHELIEVPPNLQQTFPGVRAALSNLVQTMAQIGLPLPPADSTPREVLDEFRRRDENGSLDRAVGSLIAHAPAVQQAEAKLLQAHRDVEQAELNLRYCDIVSEIDGVVTRRNVNPGNNVDVAQTLMAVRSIREIWIDANFKEGQLADLRIGQPVRCEVDMYGSRHEFQGRITGFTMGTGQTLSLLPAQNATGNFVKIVQRLPVRIELTDYNPDRAPLFVGLSVVPYVYYKKPPQGPHAGDILQPYAPLPQLATNPVPPGTQGKARRD